MLVDLTSPEMLERARLGRLKAIRKGVYGDAIRDFCLECRGTVPTESNPCTMEAVNDGRPCRLLHVSTRTRRMKVTKTALKTAIRKECIFCLGTNDLGLCSSPQCALYPLAGRQAKEGGDA